MRGGAVAVRMLGAGVQARVRSSCPKSQGVPGSMSSRHLAHPRVRHRRRCPRPASASVTRQPVLPVPQPLARLRGHRWSALSISLRDAGADRSALANEAPVVTHGAATGQRPSKRLHQLSAPRPAAEGQHPEAPGRPHVGDALADLSGPSRPPGRPVIGSVGTMGPEECSRSD